MSLLSVMVPVLTDVLGWDRVRSTVGKDRVDSCVTVSIPVV